MKSCILLLFCAVSVLTWGQSSEPAPPMNMRAEVMVGRGAPHVEKLENKEHIVHLLWKHPDGTIFGDEWTHNLRTNGGADAQSSQMGNTSTQAASCNYFALSNDATAPASTDCAAGATSCTLTSEIVSNGLARAQSSYSHTNGTTAFALQYTFTATATQSAQKAGVFNAASNGVMCWEFAFTQKTLNSGDTLTVTETVNY